MAVLLMRLAGPMQSWGIASRFGFRDTRREPSKSGVIGLLCAALGAPREDEATVARLAALRMGVRVNREGVLAEDFQTIGGGGIEGQRYGVARANGGLAETVLSRREYLADADFTVGLEGDDPAWLAQLDGALRAPEWPLYLGRRSYPPALAVAAGVAAGTLEEALALGPGPGLRLVLETPPGEGELRRDVPLSFRHDRRAFGVRYVRVTWLPREGRRA